MTSNRDRAAEVIQKTLGCMAISAENTACRLANEGVLKDDLPEPTGDFPYWKVPPEKANTTHLFT